MPWNIDGTFFSQYRSQLAWLFSLSLAAIAGSCSHAPLDMQKHLQEQLITAKPGAVIEVPEGKFHFDRRTGLQLVEILEDRRNDQLMLPVAALRDVRLHHGFEVRRRDFCPSACHCPSS